MVGCGIDILFGGNWKVLLVKIENLIFEDEVCLKVEWE